MSENTNTLYFDHEGNFEILVDSGAMIIDMNSIQRIVFTDHTNMIRYTFSKMRTEMTEDLYPIEDQTKLQNN